MKFERYRRPLIGELTVPGDKSISHRAVMLGAIADGITEVNGFLDGADCRSTMECFRQMGIEITASGTNVIIHGKGIYGLEKPGSTLNCGNSGTTTRLLSGLLSGQDFFSSLTGDESLKKRPMNRVILPLKQMGASISSRKNNGCAPIDIAPSVLHGITYESPIASAQVKSSILLAGLYADGATTVIEPAKSRNHSELMLSGFGANIEERDLPDGRYSATIYPGAKLSGRNIQIPADISSAAYFIAAALLVPNSEVLLRKVGINPSRDGILEVARMMGAEIEFLNRASSGGEDFSDLLVRSASLHGCTIEGSLIPRLIDELPVIAVMAAAAEGTTTIRNAEELKVKESDRLTIIVDSLKKMGADAQATEDGMIIHGGRSLHGAQIDSAKDHRIAMSFAIASLIADGVTEIKDADCVNISYPDFYRDLFMLQGKALS